MKRMLARLATVLAVLVASTAVMAPAAHAVNDGDVTILRSWRQGSCLTSDGPDVYNYGCFASPNQGMGQWRFELYWVYDRRSYRVVNVYTHRCLDSNLDGAVYTSACQDPNTWQKWYVRDFIDVFFHRVLNFTNVRTGRCLDANLAGLKPYTRDGCYSGGYQDWKPGY
jgi:hypothetical protein